MSYLLEGINVVELGTHIAIPEASRLLADWGASVIKVEPPKGEGWRTIGNSYGIPYDDDCNPIFQTPNANKKFIAINLRDEQGKELLFKLLEQADIFMTNTRLKGLEKLGITYDDIKERFPRLIYAHFSGYGELGPEKDRPGFDIAAYWAKSGMPLEWSTRESGPVRPLPGFADSTVATVALSGILAALYGREKTGHGEYLQTSLYSCALWFNSCGLIQAQYKPKGGYPRSKFEQPTPYHIIYKTRDEDYFFFSIPTWNTSCDKLLRMMHLEQFVCDERFMTLNACRKNMKFIAEVFDEAFSKMSTKEVVEGFHDLDCVFEIIADPQSVPEDLQAWENGYLQRVVLENGSCIVLPTTPIKFSNADTKEFHLASQIGGDSVEILKKLGYSQDDIAKLLQQDTVLSHGASN